jgi:hypothetical protein
VQALFLVGSFGRGEGSVLISRNRVTILSDYDFLLISILPGFAPRPSFLEELRKQYSVEVGAIRIWRPLLALTRWGKRGYWYDAKFASKLLYGDLRVLDVIPVVDGNDLSDCIGRVSRGLAELLGVFDPRFQTSELKEDERLHLIFEGVGATLRCGDSLLILNGQYHYSSRERGKRFARLVETGSVPIPGLAEAYRKASEFKLEPNLAMYVQPVRFWFEAKQAALHTMTYLLHGMIAEKTTDSPVVRGSVGNLPGFSELLLFKSKQNLLDYAAFNWNAIVKLKSIKGMMSTRKSVSDFVRSALFNLGMSINENGEIRKDLLDKSLEILRQIYPVSGIVEEETDLFQKWRLTRDALILAWRMSRK